MDKVLEEIQEKLMELEKIGLHEWLRRQTREDLFPLLVNEIIFRYHAELTDNELRSLATIAAPTYELTKLLLELEGPNVIPRSWMADAVFSGNYDIVELLLAAGGPFHPNMNIKGRPLLALVKNPELFEKLLKLGADPNKMTAYNKVPKWTPAHETVVSYLVREYFEFEPVKDAKHIKPLYEATVKQIVIALRYGGVRAYVDSLGAIIVREVPKSVFEEYERINKSEG